MLDDLRMAVRFARDFRAFLGRPYTAEDCHRLLKDQLARRDESFLRIMARAVFGNVRSPYFALMRQAKVQYGDVAAWIRRQGVEGALADPAIRGSRRFNGDHSACRVGCGGGCAGGSSSLADCSPHHDTRPQRRGQQPCLHVGCPLACRRLLGVVETAGH